MTGTSSVCITATTMPAKASTGTIAPDGLGAGWSVVGCVMDRGLRAWSVSCGTVARDRGSRADTWWVNHVCTGNYSDALAY
ncbi:hypothetical protein SY2F82_03700 [Streptomyces sp. Y2F8-2]|nr:hypothetical protein SY2F82_03700 [Streptomyces sp. Y2F8-2]